MNSFNSSYTRNIMPSKKYSDLSLNTTSNKITSNNDFNILNDFKINNQQKNYISFLDKITNLEIESPKNKPSCYSPRRNKKVAFNISNEEKNKNNNYFVLPTRKESFILPNFQKIEEDLRHTLINMNIELIKKKDRIEHSFMQTNANDLSIASKMPRRVVSSNQKKSNETKFFFKNFLSDSNMSNTDIISPIHKLKKVDNKKSGSIIVVPKKKKKKKSTKKNNPEKKFRNLISKQKVFDSMDDDESEEETEQEGIYISPDNIIILILDYIILICSLYAMIFIPIEMFTINNFCEYNNNFVHYFKYFVNFIYTFDFLISFFRGYYDYNCQMVKSNKKILINYLQNDFLFDLIEALPINHLTGKWCDIGIKKFTYIQDSKLITFKILMLLKSLKVLKVLAFKHNQPIQYFLDYIEGNFLIFQLVKMVIFILICIFCLHLLICFHIFISNQHYPNWISINNFQNYNLLENYINSLYFIITTMTTVGYGDIVGITLIERIFQIILLALGSVAYSYIISNIGNYVKNENYAQIKYEKDSNILEEIRISYPSMPFQLYNKIHKQLISRTRKEHKLDLNILISSLPYALKSHILFSVYDKTIKNFKIFKNINHSEFITHVLTCFIPVFIKKDNYLIIEGEMVENMIFVKDGKLSLEATINVNEPEKSVQIIQKNFDWIIETEEDNNVSINDKSITKSSINEKSFSAAKNELDILFSREQIKGRTNTYNMNNSFEEAYFYREMGKIDFCEEGFKNYGKQITYDFLKIIELQKNEYYGSVCVITQKPSPLSLKVKSKNAQVLLLCKKDVLVIARTFPNIWKRVCRKSYKNLISVKKMTINVLKNYCKNLGGLLMDNGNIFYNSYSRFNSKTSMKNRRRGAVNLQNISDIINLKNMYSSSIVNTSSIIKKNHKKLKKYENNSYSARTDDQINFSSLLYSKLHKSSKRKIFSNDDYYEISEIKESKKMENSFLSGELVNNKNMKKLSSKNTENVNQTAFIFCPNKSTSKDLTEFNNQKNSNENIDISHIKTIKCTNPKVINKNSENINFISMSDIPTKFMLKMKKRLQRNKKKEKIKRIFKIMKNFVEKNKSLVQNFENIGFFSDTESPINNTIMPTRTIVTQFLRINLDETDTDSTSDLERTSSNKFDILKISQQSSFIIDSSYENINEIYSGKLTTNPKYKDELKYLLTQSLNKTNYFYDPCMQSFNNFTLTNKKLSNDDSKRRSMITFAMESNGSIKKYCGMSNASNNVLKIINNENENNYTKNKKTNFFNDKSNYSNSSLINKQINTIEKLNIEKNVIDYNTINLHFNTTIKKNEKNIELSNDINDVISNTPNLNHSQYNIDYQKEMESENNNLNKTYNTKTSNNLFKSKKYTETPQRKIDIKSPYRHSSIGQISCGKRGSLFSQYKDNLDKVKMINKENYNKFDDSNENEFEVNENNKSRCHIF